ncbi:MAG: NAD(P)H-hydrate dehydratase [Helicobacteraceae bacterium]
MRALYEHVGDLDEKARKKYFIDEKILMEHAALALAGEIEKRFSPCVVLIVCGTGNNGADGLVLARLLDAQGFAPLVFMPNATTTEAGAQELETLKALGVEFVKDLGGIASAKHSVVVDCLFGSGLNRALEEDAARLVEQMNALGGYKIACDIPSGIQKSGEFDVCFRADLTVTMGAPKIALFLDGNKDFVGEIVTANLGIKDALYEDPTPYFLLEKSDLRLPHRNFKNVHKGDFGHLCVVGGAMTTAAVMAGVAALKFGAGLVTLINKDNYPVPPILMQSKKMPQNCSAVVVGMGLGQKYIDDEILDLTRGKTLVLDADLFSMPLIATLLKQETKMVLTPHPKEFASLLSLLGEPNIDTQTVQKRRFALAQGFMQKFPNACLVLKGSNTIIAAQGKLFVNNLGTPSLAKAGSGDVLAGMIGALLVQGYTPLDAAISASLAHSLAACNYPRNNYSLTADALIDEIMKL